MSQLKFAVAAGALVAAVIGGTAAAASSPLNNLGPAKSGTLHVYTAYYDGHFDTYVLTDVSSKSQAAALKLNYSAGLAEVKGAPFQYFIQGKAAKGQLSVFGSEPGEDDYNPLWDELFVTWKLGVKPVLLVRDDQIDALQKKGELTVRDAHIILNAPILTHQPEK
jgi:hypothetical protein